MTNASQGLRPVDLAHVIEAAVVDYWRACCSYIPGAAFHSDGGLDWYRTGLTVAPWLNGVLRTELSAGDEARIGETLAMFARDGLPLLWAVTPSSTPADLAAQLQDAGLTPVDPLVGMAIDLAEDLGDVALPEGFTLERAIDLAGLERWGHSYIYGFGMPEAAGRAMFDIYAAAGFEDSVPFRHYYGLLDGAPVASATLFLGDGVAGVWHVSTAQAARGRGIGGAMTLAPLLDAAALGCRLGSLYATAMGAGVYRRLGFQEYTTMTQYGTPS